MFLVAAIIIFLLRGFGVLEDNEDVEWLFIGLALFAISFLIDFRPWSELRRG